jgi:hypothetical protein
LSQYARIQGEKVIEIVDIDPVLYASWRDSANPKANAYLPLFDTPKPDYNPDTHALVEAFDVGLANVVRLWSIRPLTPVERRKVWSTLDFLSRFTTSEMNAIEIARSDDGIVQSFYRAALAAQEVVNDDTRTVAGMDYLVTIGILTHARRNEILG